jgi:hypothetical protein
MQIREVADQENNVLGGAPPPARAMIDRVTLLGGLAWPCWGRIWDRRNSDNTAEIFRAAAQSQNLPVW